MPLDAMRSPFKLRLDRRDSSALVEAWVVVSRQKSDESWERVAGPFTLKQYKAKVQHSPEMNLGAGKYRCKVEVTATEDPGTANLYNFRVSVVDGTSDEMIFDQRVNDSIDTSEEVDVVAAADAFDITIV